MYFSWPIDNGRDFCCPKRAFVRRVNGVNRALLAQSISQTRSEPYMCTNPQAHAGIVQWRDENHT